MDTCTNNYSCLNDPRWESLLTKCLLPIVNQNEIYRYNDYPITRKIFNILLIMIFNFCANVNSCEWIYINIHLTNISHVVVYSTCKITCVHLILKFWHIFRLTFVDQLIALKAFDNSIAWHTNLTLNNC